MVIGNMFVYHFVDPDLRVETFFEKDEAAENRGYRPLCTLISKAEENFMWKPVCFLIVFL